MALWSLSGQSLSGQSKYYSKPCHYNILIIDIDKMDGCCHKSKKWCKCLLNAEKGYTL